MKAGDQGCTSVSARATKGVYMVAKDSPWGRWVCVHDRFEGYEGRPSRVESVEILWVKTLTRPQSHILDSNSTAHVHPRPGKPKSKLQAPANEGRARPVTP